VSDYRQLFDKGLALRYTNPQVGVEQMLAGSRLAKEAGDEKAALYFDRWILQTLIYNLRDYARAYDVAVEATVRARKAIHKDQQERICVHRDLVTIYLSIDPLGNINVIREALEYLKQEITAPIQCRFCLLGTTSTFELTCGSPEKAEEAAQHYLAEAEGDRHHQGNAYLGLCNAAHKRQAWEDLLDYAKRGEQVIGNVSTKVEKIAQVLMAQALALRKLGRDSEALVAYRLATTKASAFKGTMQRSYYSLLCDFFLAAGNLQEALSTRERQLREMVDKGQPYWEAITRLEHAHLLKRLDKPFAEEIEPIRSLAAKLRKPEIILDQVDALLAGNE
jgi:hypothetical protein